MIKELWFRVKYGFQALEIVSIQDDELEKALYAQKYGVVVQLSNKQINGKYIISIEPHYHKYTGWFPNYEPANQEDWRQIERDCPKELEQTIRQKRERVDYLIAHNKTNLIGQNVAIPEIDSKHGEVVKISGEVKQLKK